MRIYGTFLVAVCMASQQSHAADSPTHFGKAPARLELRDQYDALQRLAFPATNIIVLTIADKQGSGQIDGWLTALKARYNGRIELRGLADVAGVPAMLHGKVRKKFRETRTYPVMMDWSGTNCVAFGYKKGVANILLLGHDGTIHARFTGAATPDALAQAHTALDKILHSPLKPVTLPAP